MNEAEDAARVLALTDETTQARLRDLLAYVLEANQTLNLTAVREAETAWPKPHRRFAVRAAQPSF